MTRIVNTWHVNNSRRGKRRTLARFELAEVQAQYDVSIDQYSREHNGATMPASQRRALWQTLIKTKTGG
jgi:hypothetical protein